VEPSSSYALIVGGNVKATTFNATSDYRIKENVEPLTTEYNVDYLKPCSYKMKDTDTKKRQTGFIAHELQEVYPHLVNGEKDGENMQTINYIGLIPILTAEIQRMKLRIDELEQRLG